MRLPPDYHMHTPLCRHAVGEPSEFAARAVELGLAEIGFSDHAPMPRDDFDDWRMRDSDLNEYVAGVERARREFPSLSIKLALEVDYLPGYEDWVCDLAGRHKWDYLIGSVHYVSESWAIDNPSRISEWKARDSLEVWTAYFERQTMAAESGLFDVLGHVDLCKRFCFYPKEDCAPLIQRFLRAAKKHEAVIEVNTAGLRKDCREIYPSARILKLAATEGVPITFGSDAHAPGEVAMNFREAIALATDAGYTHSCRFTRRKREFTPLI
jgi:histidinol-phosphatase (PHP family)